MPTLKDFIARVVPWPGANTPGVVNIHWRMVHPQSKNLIWSGRPTSTVDDFVNVVDWAVQRPASFSDIYFCTSLQGRIGRSKAGKPTVARSQQDAVALRSIFLDIDIKDPPKGYATFNEALKALDVFIKAYKLPFPTAIVESGGGMHVYWVSDKPLSPDEWRPYAEGLRAAAVQHGLRCDGGVTIDSARILRVPGTFNYKIPGKPRPVAIKYLHATDINFTQELGQLAIIAPSTPSIVTAAVTPAYDLSGFTAGGMAKAFSVLDPKAESLSDGIEHNNDPLDPSAILAKGGCPYFRDAFATHGRDAGQGLWMLTVLASTFWHNGDTFAHELSNGHPDYKVEDTDAMIERKTREKAQRGLGWPSCLSFEREGCTQCAGCPHKGKIKSPLNLALTPKPQVQNIVTPQQITQSQLGLSLPQNYAVDPKTGVICEIVTLAPAAGPQAPVQELIPLFQCTLSQPWAQKDPDCLNFTASTDMGNTKDISVPLSKMMVSTDLVRCLGDQSVKPMMRNANRLTGFFVSWMAELHAKQVAIASVPFGWVVEQGDIVGFAYGGVIARPDGTEHPAGQADPKLRSKFTPCGEVNKWLAATKLITDQHRPALELITLASFAAPLVRFTGMDGATLSAVGVSGANKSAASKVGLAVWGNPSEAKETPGSSALFVEKKLGEMRNLPVYWDEIKDEETQHKVFNGVFSISEGIAGGKLNSDRSMRDRGTWQTLMILASNYNLGDFFIDVKKASAASLYRILEFTVEKPGPNALGQVATVDADRIIKDLQYNYGNAGRIYAKYLVTNIAAVDKEVYDATKNFAAMMKQSVDERLWAAICGVIVTAGSIANRTLGTDFHLEEVADFLVRIYRENRERARKNGVDVDSLEAAQDALTQFLKHYMAHSVFTHTMPGAGRVATVNPIWPLPNPNATPRAMHVHVAVTERVIRFSRQEFKRYLIWRKVPVSGTIKMLEKHFNAVHKYITIAGGTTYRRGQEWAIEIPVPPGSPLEDTLSGHEQFGSALPPPVDHLTGAPTPPLENPLGDAVASAAAQAAADLETVRKAA
jgi:hypothetical protein